MTSPTNTTNPYIYTYTSHRTNICWIYSIYNPDGSIHHQGTKGYRTITLATSAAKRAVKRLEKIDSDKDSS